MKNVCDNPGSHVPSLQSCSDLSCSLPSLPLRPSPTFYWNQHLVCFRWQPCGLNLRCATWEGQDLNLCPIYIPSAPPAPVANLSFQSSTPFLEVSSPPCTFSCGLMRQVQFSPDLHNPLWALDGPIPLRAFHSSRSFLVPLRNVPSQLHKHYPFPPQ